MQNNFFRGQSGGLSGKRGGVAPNYANIFRKKTPLGGPGVYPFGGKNLQNSIRLLDINRQNVSHAKLTFLMDLKLSFFVKPRIGRRIHCVKNVAIKMVNSSLWPIISFGHICPSIRISLVPVLVPLILLLFS